MKLLVSGTTGFIGTHLAERLIQEGHEIHAIVRPTSASKLPKGVQRYTFHDNVAELLSFMQSNKFDGVVHLASCFLAQHTSDDVQNLIRSNLEFSTVLLEAAAQSAIPWFINTGTFWQHYQNKSYSPVNLYAATKQAFQDIIEYYLEVFPITVVTLALSDTFGPGDTRPKVLNLLYKTAMSGETIAMSPGEQLLDISYIDNVIDGYIQLISLLSGKDSKTIRGKSFALLSGEAMPLKKIAETFARVTGMQPNIQWGAREYRPREVMIPWNTGERIPGWEPTVSLEAGIKKTFHE